MFSSSYLRRKQGKIPLKPVLFWLALTIAGSFIFPLETAVRAQAASGISVPAAGDTVLGVVEVRGTAVHPDYLRFELAFRQQDVPGSDWIVFAEGSEPVVNGVLAVWNTTVGREIGAPIFPDGRYELRLRVVKNDFNYDEYFVMDLVVQNSGPTPTPTPGETVIALTATAAAQPAAPTGNAGSSFQQPTPLPSLTPFPSPTPPPTVEGNSPAQPQASEEQTEGGLLRQLEVVEIGRFGNAFWLGIRITAALFLAAGLYLVLRRVARLLWHTYWAQKESKQ